MNQPLPAGWGWRSLSEVARVVQGQSPRGSSYNTAGVGMAFFQGKAQFGSRFPEVRKWTSEPSKVAAAGDILFSVRAPVGATNEAPVDCCIGRDLAAIQPGPEITKEFLLWYMEASKADLQRKAVGTTITGIPGSVLREHPVPVPPLNEQRAIVAAIEERISNLQGAQTTIARLVVKAKRLQSRVLESELAAIGAPLIPLGTFLATPLANGRSVPTVKNGQAGFPVLRLTALKRGKIDAREHKIGAWERHQALPFLIRAGDFLVARGNGSLALVGRGGLVSEDAEIAFPDTMIRVRPDLTRLDPAYLRMMWDSRQVRDYIERTARTTAGIYKINQTDLERLPIRVPELATQRSLEQRVSASRDGIARLIGHTDEAAKKAGVLRSAILHSAFTGRLVDPPDTVQDAAPWSSGASRKAVQA